MICLPILENRYQNVKISQRQSFALEQLQEVLDESKQKNILDALLFGRSQPAKHFEQIEFLASSQAGSDFWLASSGHSFTIQKARALKQAGLVGLFLSLSHYDPEKHNAIWSSKHAYGWVLKAADNARQSDLTLGLRLHLNAYLTSHQQLFTYVQLAKRLGASIIQIVEARHDHKSDCLKPALKQDQIVMLQRFIAQFDEESVYKDWPVVSLSDTLLQKLGEAKDQQPLAIDAHGKLKAMPAGQ